MKRTSKELKRIARDILNDRYRVPMAAFAATTLIATLIESPFSFSMGDNPTNMQLVISLIAELLISVVSFVLGCGVAKIHLSMTRGNDFLVRDIFDPFKKNTDRFFIAGFLFLLMIFVSMIPVIGGFTYAVIADFFSGFYCNCSSDGNPFSDLKLLFYAYLSFYRIYHTRSS